MIARSKLPVSCPMHAGFPVSCPICLVALAPKDAGVERSHRRDAEAREGVATLARIDSRKAPKRTAKRSLLDDDGDTSLPPPPPRSDRPKHKREDPVAVVLPKPPKVPREAKVRLVAAPKAHPQTRWIVIDGERVPLIKAGADRGVGRSTVEMRLRRGWTERQAVGLDPHPRAHRSDAKWLTWKGETLTLNGWAKRLGIHHSTMHWRLARGLKGEALFASGMRTADTRGRFAARPLVELALAAIHGPPERAKETGT